MKAEVHPSRFLVVEGMSATGKTTVAPLLANRIRAKFMASIPSEFTPARRVAEAAKDVNVRHLVYSAALGVSQLRVKEELQQGYSVVLESYFDRANAYHRAMGSTLEDSSNLFLRPDVVVVLHCDQDARLRRMRERDRTESHWMKKSEEVYEKIEAYYEQLPGIHIDTSHLAPAEVVEAIASRLS